MKNLALVFTGMALMLVLVLGWNMVRSEAEAQGPAVDEVWAAYGTPNWNDFQDTLNILHNRGYRLRGYSVTRNTKGQLVKFAAMERP